MENGKLWTREKELRIKNAELRIRAWDATELRIEN